MKRFFALALVAAVSIGMFVLLPSGVSASSKDQICQGANSVSGGTGCTGGSSDIDRVLTVGLNTFSIVVGIIAVIMMVVAGFKYITAGGDSGNITSAKHTMVYVIVGLVIVALSQFIVQFVLDKASN